MLDDYSYEKLTPMLKHYIDIKKDFKDAILLYRVGDFFETFFEDAIITSRSLQLALTGKECGHSKKAPMCGVPQHVIDNYVNKLVKQGHKVALCDQVEDPKFAKGLVKRAVTKIVTPGTVTDIESLEKNSNNFLMSIYFSSNAVFFSYVDVTTGNIKEFYKCADTVRVGKFAVDQIEKLAPTEIIINSDFDNKILKEYFNANQTLFINYISKTEYSADDLRDYIRNYLGAKILDKINTLPGRLVSVSNLLGYIYRFQKEKLSHINTLDNILLDQYMQIDANTKKNLEISINLSTNSRKDSLLSIIDDTSTAMGSRLLSQWIDRPLLEKDKIQFRLDTVDYLVHNTHKLRELRNYLKTIFDLERICSKISFKNCNARDLLALKNSIECIPQLKEFLLSLDSKNLNDIATHIYDTYDIYNLLNNSINENAPISITEGMIIKKNYNEKLDKLRDDIVNANQKLIDYENQQREVTDIKNLKIKYNKNNGYSIEVTKTNIDKVPANYIRKQTLKNQERYTTEKLEYLSNLILNGADKVNDLEYELFSDIRSNVIDNIKIIQSVAKMIANLDVLSSFAYTAIKNNFRKPFFTDNDEIIIEEGRHPIIESKLKENEFIKNDTLIGNKDNLIQLLTGPNMAGKSTYMRQIAIVIILAHTGSFVPAKKCILPIVDKIFTRIGASDNISKGDSTFMLEMREVANILENATEKSFVILDEVGRGTSTQDGLSIACALVEYLSRFLKCKTIFATHFHELTDLKNQFENVRNLKVDIDKDGDKLVFLHKIKSGESDNSYGIEVAKLAGLPEIIIEKAQQLVQAIEKKDIELSPEDSEIQKIAYQDRKYIDKFKSLIDGIDINNITPLEALNVLYNLKKDIEKL